MFGLVLMYLKVSYLVGAFVGMGSVACVTLWYLWSDAPSTGNGTQR